jgi:hypothetical protein
VRVRGGAALVGVLAAMLLPATSVPAQADPVEEGTTGPSLSVWPRVDLVDDELLLINVRQFPTDGWLVLTVCPAGVNPRRAGCDHIGSVDTGPEGNVRVRRRADVIVDRTSGLYDCRAQPCEIVVYDPNGEGRSPVLRAGIGFDPSGPDPVRPALSASPNEGLRNGDEISVSGQAYPLFGEAGGPAAGEGDDGPARPVTIRQCRLPADSTLDCENGVTVGMTSEGAFSTTVTLRSRLYLNGGASVDCRATPCGFIATSNGEYSESGVVPLALDPSGPGPAPPTFSVEPSTNLVDGQVVTITAEHSQPRTDLWLFVCPEGARGYGFRSCHEAEGLLRTDIHGNRTITHSAHALVERWERATLDCRVVACSFVVTWADQVDDAEGVPFDIDPAAPLLAHRLTASPTADLVDLQEITVTGEGYYTTDITRVAQCVVRRQHPDDDNCAERDRLVILDDSDRTSFTTTLRVRRRMFAGGGWVNCAVRTCYLRSGDYENGTVRGPNLRFSP